MAAGIWFSACFVGLVGLSFHGSINGALERNVTATVGGHLQVYSGTTRNELEIFGKDDGTMANVGVIENANAIADRLRKVDNIERVVPLGSGTAMLVTGNLLDRELEKLRDSVREQDEQRTHVAFKRVRGVIEWLREEDSEISTSPALQRTADEEFWRGFASSPWPVLEFLESDVAPLLGNAKVVVLSLLGAEPEVFSKSFDRFEIVEGQQIPPGKDGILLNQRLVDEGLTGSLTELFDRLHKERRNIDHFNSVAEELRNRTPALLRELAAEEHASLTDGLRVEFPDEPGLGGQIRRLLTVTPESVGKHRELYRELIEPVLGSRMVEIGDELVVQGIGPEGQLRAVRVRVFGFFRFKGMEDFEFASRFCLVNMDSFRKWYNAQTETDRVEMRELADEADITTTDRESIESVLFANVDALESTQEDVARPWHDLEPGQPKGEATTNASQLVTYFALLLHDTELLEETLGNVEAVLAKEPLPLRVVSWRNGAGWIGEYFSLVRVQLLIAAFVALLVMAVVVNTTLVVATMERYREIGTLRSLGATRGLVLWLHFTETAILVVTGGGVGLLVGAGVLKLVGTVGIPAGNFALLFIFGGARLYPTFDAWQMFATLSATLCFGILATIFPANMAAKIEPASTMRGEGR